MNWRSDRTRSRARTRTRALPSRPPRGESWNYKVQRRDCGTSLPPASGDVWSFKVTEQLPVTGGGMEEAERLKSSHFVGQQTAGLQTAGRKQSAARWAEQISHHFSVGKKGGTAVDAEPLRYLHGETSLCPSPQLTRRSSSEVYLKSPLRVEYKVNPCSALIVGRKV